MTVCADSDLLRQVIENLLSNACKYTPFGESVRLRLVFRPAFHVTSVVGQGSTFQVELPLKPCSKARFCIRDADAKSG